MARPQKVRCICSIPATAGFMPQGGAAGRDVPCVTLGYDEYETLRLLDYSRHSQEQCARRMNVSRATVARIYESARRKLADALVNGKRIEIGGGDVAVCAAAKPECAGEAHCCRRHTKTAPAVEKEALCRRERENAAYVRKE